MTFWLNLEEYDLKTNEVYEIQHSLRKQHIWIYPTWLPQPECKARSIFVWSKVWFKIYFGLVLWHTNHSGLFNAKYFYAYISNIWVLNTILDNSFKRVWTHFLCTQINVFIYFYLIWTILFIINHFFRTQLNVFKYCYFTHAIQLIMSIFCPQLNDSVLFQIIQFGINQQSSRYCYASLTIKLNISYLFTHS